MTSEITSQSGNMVSARTATAVGLLGRLQRSHVVHSGASCARIGALVGLAPLQPYFLAATIACLACGYWLAYRSRHLACATGRNCGTPGTDKRVTSALVLATALVVLAIGFKFLIPLLDS